MPELRRSSRVKRGAVEKPETKPKPNSKPAKQSKPVKMSSSDSESSELEVGDLIPDITLLDEDENEINLLEKAKSAKFFVLFAYPKASTPGCTRQACGFRDNFNALKEKDAIVYGISSDSPKSQKNFITKQHLNYSLLSDPSKKLIGPLGAKKSPSGIKRSHWIFVDGVLTVKKVQISPEQSFTGVKNDIDELIKKN